MNQDGRSSSLTAPNGPSQQEVISAALHSGDLAAWQVSHLQMHGTGEVKSVFPDHHLARAKCALLAGSQAPQLNS